MNVCSVYCWKAYKVSDNMWSIQIKQWALQAKRCLENIKDNVLIFLHAVIKGHVFACSVDQGWL